MDKHYSAGIDFLRAFAVIAVILYICLNILFKEEIKA